MIPGAAPVFSEPMSAHLPEDERAAERFADEACCETEHLAAFMTSHGGFPNTLNQLTDDQLDAVYAFLSNYRGSFQNDYYLWLMRSRLHGDL